MFACKTARSARSLTGETGRKAQVVLDAHAAAGLPARRRALEDYGIQSFGCAVDGGGETRRSGAHDREVVHRALESLADADGIGEIPVRRVAKHVLGTDDDRRFGFGDAEVPEELIDVGIGLEVSPGEEHQVLGQEVPDAERIGRIARTDDAKAGERARLTHQLPAGHEGAEDDVAEIRALVDDLLDERAGDGVDLAVAERHSGKDRRGASQVRHVAGELAAAVDGNGLRRLTGLVENLDLP